MADVVLHTFHMSKEQWRQLGERTRIRKIQGTLRSQWGKAWCVEKGVLPTDEGMMTAFNEGTLLWQASVVECIDYDADLLQQVIKAQE
jgi:Domain of unknown function (DUF6697)